MRFAVACLSLGFFSFLAFGVHTQSITLAESTDPNVTTYQYPAKKPRFAMDL